MTTVHEAKVEICFIDGLPTGFDWHEQHWQVIDSPTEIGPGEAVYSPLVTHPLHAWSGWRFIAKAEDGETLVFDIRTSPSGWDVIRVYR